MKIRSVPAGKREQKIMTTEVEHEGVPVQAPSAPDAPAPEPEEYFFTNPGQILDRDDQQWGKVAVPEWAPAGHPHPERWNLRLRGLTGRERDLFEASINQTRGGKQKQNFDNFRARLIIQCAVNPDGQKLFSRADLKRLGEKSAKALDRVFTECNKLNGFTEEDVESLTEGFGDDPNGGSTSD